MEGNLIPSNKGGKKLEINGYLFHREKTTNDVTRWCCAKRKSLYCKSRVSTIVGENPNVVKITLEPTNHSHQLTKPTWTKQTTLFVHISTYFYESSTMTSVDMCLFLEIGKKAHIISLLFSYFKQTLKS